MSKLALIARRVPNAVRAANRATLNATAQGVSDSVWAKLRWCESRGNYAEDSGNGYYGAYQFDLTSWRSVGGTGLPSTAPPSVQDEAAKRLLSLQGWHAWPTCTWILGL